MTARATRIEKAGRCLSCNRGRGCFTAVRKIKGRGRRFDGQLETIDLGQIMPCPLEASLPPQPSNNTSLHTPPPRTFAKMNRNLVQIAHSSSRRQRPSHTGSLHSELLCVCVCVCVCFCVLEMMRKTLNEVL